MAEMNIDGVQMNAVLSVPATMNMDGVTVNVVTRLAGANQYKRTPRVELLEALAGSTGIPLNPVQYDIGPVVNEDPPTAKATIDLIALEASGKRRTTPVVYRRRNPNELFQTLELDNFKPTDANPIGSLSQLVDVLNRIYGLTLAVKDFKAVEISQGSNTVVTTSPTSWYFEPNISINLGRLDGNDRQFELLSKGLNWPVKTLVGQQAFFTKDTFRVEFNKLFGDTFTQAQTQTPDVSAPNVGATSNRDRQITLTFTVGSVVTTKTVYYFQLPLSALPTQLVTSTVWDLWEGKLMDAANLTELAAIAGLPLNEVEFVNTDLTDATPAGQMNVTFKAKPDSKFFKGEVTIPITRAPWVTDIVPSGSSFSL